MSLFKRPDSKYWWAKFRIRGREIRASTGHTSRAKARKAEARLREGFRDRAHGVGHTWDEAAERWLEERASKRSLSKDEEILAWLQPHITGLRLEAITRDALEDLRQKRRRSIDKRTKKPVSASTTNRTMSLVRAILKACVDDWEWLSRAPKVAMYKLEQKEPRWITEAQFDRLIAALNRPHSHARSRRTLCSPHLAKMARFAVHTGLRRANITGLRWRDVDLVRRHVTVAGPAAKGKRGIAVPLDAAACQVLRECLGEHPVHAFTYEGRPVTQVSTKAWREAARIAGIPGFRFHDLRHTWASWHVQQGTSLSELQALGGWRSLAMVQRYAHLSSASLRAAAGRLDGIGVPDGDSGTEKKTVNGE